MFEVVPMDFGDFQELVIERYAVPRRLTDDEFGAWMHGRRIFISSVMDVEMNPDRRALRSWVRRWGGIPIMWEEIVPRDERADHTYLDGVDRCDVFVMALGTMYGVADADGASPTFKENKRATEQGKMRLVAKKANVRDQDRDARLTPWIRSLYNELSLSEYASPEALTEQVEERLRETAAQQELPWVKIGKAIFPGRVHQQHAGGVRTFVVSADLSDRAVLDNLSGNRVGWNRRDLDRITFGESTYPITDVSVETAHDVQSRTRVTVSCRQDHQRSDGSPLGGIAYNTPHGEQITPARQVELWAEYALFGKPKPPKQGFGLDMFVYPRGLTLPEIFQREGARGWLAEGLTRLYIVEELIKKYGGGFHRLSVGPAMASGVRVEVVLQPQNYGNETAVIQGIVSFP